MSLLLVSLAVLGLVGAGAGTVHAAFSTLMRLTIRLVPERGGRHVQLERYLDDPLTVFVPLRVLLASVHVLAAVVLAFLVPVSSWTSGLEFALALGGFVFTFEHVVPVILASRDPERTVERALPVLAILTRVLAPLTSLVRHRIAPVRRDRTAGSGGEEEGGVAQAQAGRAAGGPTEGMIRQEERRLLRSIVEFGDTLVREVMTPRPDIVAIRSDATLDELKELFREQEYSRIPVYEENLDRIVGVVYVKDLIRRAEGVAENPPISSVMRPVHFVPETKKVSELLREFQRERLQTALVVDEYGGTAGLVTVEDLLEEIVGEIRDEYDEETDAVVDEGHGSFLLSGKADIEQVAERLAVTIPHEGFETVGGFLLARLGRVPSAGERFELDGLAVEVTDAERWRVKRVRVKRLSPSVPAAPAE